MIQKYSTPDVKITNQEFELYKEDGRYYLRVDFDYENDYGVYKGHIDKVKFNVLFKGIESEICSWTKSAKANFLVPSEYSCVDCSFDIVKDSKDNFFTIEVIKEKVYEMSVEEIEKKLGHKIKIISK